MIGVINLNSSFSWVLIVLSLAGTVFAWYTIQTKVNSHPLFHQSNLFKDFFFSFPS